jgi:hypothetical protein
MPGPFIFVATNKVKGNWIGVVPGLLNLLTAAAYQAIKSRKIRGRGHW